MVLNGGLQWLFELLLNDLRMEHEHKLSRFEDFLDYCRVSISLNDILELAQVYPHINGVILFFLVFLV